MGEVTKIRNVHVEGPDYQDNHSMFCNGCGEEQEWLHVAMCRTGLVLHCCPSCRDYYQRWRRKRDD
jgi:hypothetical protein